MVEVAAHASNVLLITDRDAATAARLVDTHQAGLLEGQGDADMKMSFLNREVDRANRAPSWRRTGTVNGLYPPGITIGEVSRFVPATSDRASRSSRSDRPRTSARSTTWPWS